MATLEDKLLGEKLEYYCSSDEEDESASQIKQDAEACPPAPNMDECYRRANNSSTNTGPKGVVQDWQRFKQLEAEQREANELQRLELAKKLTMTTATAAEEEERKRQEELDTELAELMSEDFLQQFQKKRMAEMLQQCGGNNRQFGKVLHLTTNQEFLDCIEVEDKYTTVIIHIYDPNVSACATLNKCLDTLATDYNKIKFAKISTSVAGMSREFRSKGLPALIVYKAQAVIGNFVRLTDDLSSDFFPSDVESFLIENGILIDRNLYS